MKGSKILNAIYSFLILAIVAITFFNGILIALVGIRDSFHIYIDFFQDVTYKPVIKLVKVLDSFIVAIVFIMFSLGFGELFLPKYKVNEHINLKWLQINSFGDLKTILWNTILLAILIVFASSIIQNYEDLQWNDLILPITIALLALASKFIKH